MKNLYYVSPVLLLLFLVSCQQDELKNTFSISGYVGYEGNPLIPGQPEFKVNLLENDQVILTQTGSEYSFTNLAEGKTYSVIPFVEETSAAGITTVDFVMVRQFTEGLGTLTAFQQLAADVDKNNIINQTDLDLLSSCLLLNECFSYRFASPDYQGPGTAYVDEYKVESLDANHIANFKPIKIGDINN